MSPSITGAILPADLDLLLIAVFATADDRGWLAQGELVPPKPIRALRNLTRYRKTQIQERAREANRLHTALEDTGIKLDCVATDILGVSGRACLTRSWR